MKQGVEGRMRTRPPPPGDRHADGGGRARTPLMLSCRRRRMTQIESSEAAGDEGAHGCRREGRGLCPVCFPRASPSVGRPRPAGEGGRSFSRSTALSCGLFPSPDSIMCRSPPPPLPLPPDRPPKGSSLQPRASERQVSGRRRVSGLALPCGRPLLRRRPQNLRRVARRGKKETG